MIKDFITQIVSDITDIDLIQRFGGYCDLELIDGIETGIKKDGEIDCHGTTYTPDERFASVGFLYIDSWETKKSEHDRKSNELDLVIGVKLYFTPAKLGERVNYYEAGLEFITELNKKGYKFSGRASRTNQKFEMVTLLYTKKMYVPCDYTFTPATALSC